MLVMILWLLLSPDCELVFARKKNGTIQRMAAASVRCLSDRQRWRRGGWWWFECPPVLPWIGRMTESVGFVLMIAAIFFSRYPIIPRRWATELLSWYPCVGDANDWYISSPFAWVGTHLQIGVSGRSPKRKKLFVLHNLEIAVSSHCCWLNVWPLKIHWPLHASGRRCVDFCFFFFFSNSHIKPIITAHASLQHSSWLRGLQVNWSQHDTQFLRKNEHSKAHKDTITALRSSSLSMHFFFESLLRSRRRDKTVLSGHYLALANAILPLWLLQVHSSTA